MQSGAKKTVTAAAFHTNCIAIIVYNSDQLPGSVLLLCSFNELDTIAS